MSTFVDTSAILAVLNSADQEHTRAASVFRTLLEDDEILISNHYVVLETVALVQRRMGLTAVATFLEDILPSFRVEWITEDVHAAAMDLLITLGRRHLSLVDCSSFITMRRLGIKRAFAFDGDFPDHGFEQIPAQAPDSSAAP